MLQNLEWSLYAAAFLGTATVVRQGRDVFNRLDLQPRRLQRRNGALAAAAGPFHLHVDFLHAELDGLLGHLLRRQLPGKGRALAASLETTSARARPTECLALGDGLFCELSTLMSLFWPPLGNSE